MITDENGLPVQRDFDAGDQLNRVGLLSLLHDRWYIQLAKLRVSPGVYRRGTNLPTNTVSGDQLVPVFGAATSLPQVWRGATARHFDAVSNC